MQKLTFQNVQADLYQEVTPEGLKVLVAPIKGSKSIWAGLYVRTGSFRHEDSIDNVKTPSGTAHLLEKMLHYTPKGFADNIFDSYGAVLYSATTYSSSIFSFTTYDDWKKPLDLLLTMTSNLSFKEADIIREKESIIVKYEDERSNPLASLFQELLNNLYSESPLREPICGNTEDIKTIHLSNLKKYFASKYSIDNMTLIVYGDVRPSEIHSFLETRKLVIKPVETKREERINKEEYGKVVKPFSTIKGDFNKDMIGIAVKFLPRMELWERYDYDLFAIYATLENTLFGSYTKLMENLTKLGLTTSCDLFKLIEGGEDASIIAAFSSFDPERLKTELLSFFSRLDKEVKEKDFKLAKNSFIGQNVVKLGVCKNSFLAAVNAYDNYLPHASLIEKVSALKWKTMKRFLKDLSTWSITTVRVESKGEN